MNLYLEVLKKDQIKLEIIREAFRLSNSDLLKDIIRFEKRGDLLEDDKFTESKGILSIKESASFEIKKLIEENQQD